MLLDAGRTAGKKTLLSGMRVLVGRHTNIHKQNVEQTGEQRVLRRKRKQVKPGMVAHTFNPSIGKKRHWDLFEFKNSLVYRVSSTSARAR